MFPTLLFIAFLIITGIASILFFIHGDLDRQNKKILSNQDRILKILDAETDSKN